MHSFEFEQHEKNTTFLLYYFLEIFCNTVLLFMFVKEICFEYNIIIIIIRIFLYLCENVYEIHKYNC